MELTLTPNGHLILSPKDEAGALRDAFERGSGHGLLYLGADRTGAALPAVYAFWRDFGGRYVTAVCTQAGNPHVPPPSTEELEWIVLAAPPMTGSEYLTAAVLENLWRELDLAFADELSDSGLNVQEFLKARNPAWNLVGRVHFHLAENRGDPEFPFAFLATYTSGLSAHAKAQHLQLGQALREYAGAANKDRLLSLLLPVQRAAEGCPWLKAMIDAGEIFHPLRWTAREAMQVLNDVPQLEAAGVLVRMPAAWRGSRPPRPRVSGVVGTKPPSALGQEALLDFSMAVTLDGERLTEEEVRELLAKSDGLAMVRGKWVQINREHLGKLIEQFRRIEQTAGEQGLGFAEAMRLLAGADIAGGVEDAVAEESADWRQISAGPWLAETLRELRSPEAVGRMDAGTPLRPYQQVGVQWLYLLTKLGLGACLADDMGLGKTLQVLSLLRVLKQQAADNGRPSLLVAPASLLANWAAEMERFTPDLRSVIAHPSAMPAVELKKLSAERLGDTDLVITSYGSLLRIPWLAETTWRLAILDEAQAIKNPGAKQTRAVKQVKAGARVALTGTPVENRLGDLWSIFDFINPGLLGSAKQFTTFSKSLAKNKHASFAPLRELVKPYILRRLKTDRSVISDLPDKTEMKAFCGLSKRQAALYEQSVTELATRLADADGMQRKGLVLAFLMRFKQICNHPSQWLGDGGWGEEDSGKLARLREIAEVVAAKQEKMLVFTQFRETTAPLAAFLGSVFGAPGLVLHGETAVKNRKELVRRFQEDETERFFVLSLKAGGSGLNLTAASHVVHFDRWWNPAVENQATDRAFRIGQKKNVLVHKFVCRGTVEEKIDELIESKKQISRDVLEGGGELLLTEMNNDDLLKLVALDLGKAMQEG
jgi:superfamily II DNA or RNA helicase